MRARALPCSAVAAAALLTALAFAGPAGAQRLSPVTGEALAKLCAGKAVTGCDAYVSGVSDAGELLGRSGPEPAGRGAARFCIPADVKGAALRQTVLAWAEGHPEDGRQPAAMLVVHALHASYPCQGAAAGGAEAR